MGSGSTMLKGHARFPRATRSRCDGYGSSSGASCRHSGKSMAAEAELWPEHKIGRGGLELESKGETRGGMECGAHLGAQDGSVDRLGAADAPESMAAGGGRRPKRKKCRCAVVLFNLPGLDPVA